VLDLRYERRAAAKEPIQALFEGISYAESNLAIVELFAKLELDMLWRVWS
jgi:hypothetical protein